MEHSRVVPREVCMEHSERSNRYREITLNIQKSAEAVVAELISEEKVYRQCEDQRRKSGRIIRKQRR